MSETRYSHDQKEKAFNMMRSLADKQKAPFPYSCYQDIERGIVGGNNVFDWSVFNSYLEDEASPYLPELSGRKIVHPLDIEYFKEYRAPIMELMQSSHYTNINSTISFFGPMLYYLCRAIGVEQVLEIGVAEGYTSWYLANAVKDNGVRYKMAGNMYYGIDILDRTDVVKPRLDLAGLPNKLIQMDSINLTKETFKDVQFDLIFQDGAHDTEHVVKEIEILYPQLKGKGNGFLICHDVYGPSYEGVKQILADKRYEWEYVRICEIYGLAILRKMEGYVERNPWV